MEDINTQQDAEKARKKIISKLLQKLPLYTTVELSEFYPHDSSFLDGHTFNFFCKEENSMQTFSLHVMNENIKQFFPIEQYSTHNGGYVSGTLLSFSDYCVGLCSSCKKYKLDFLINCYTKKPKKLSNAGVTQDNPFKQESIFLRKIGQNPPYEIKPEKEVLDYLTEQDAGYYKKALMNISHGYGIGAFAYFRRVIENEIKRIVTDVSKLSPETEAKMKDVMLKYEKDHQMSYLIDEISKYLPPTLSSLGNNPIRVLYEQFSVGLHGLTEEKCLEKATLADTILKFVIKQINAEKNEMKSVREAMKNINQ